jgi:hypothetical protein
MLTVPEEDTACVNMGHLVVDIITGDLCTL